MAIINNNKVWKQMVAAFTKLPDLVAAVGVQGDKATESRAGTEPEVISFVKESGEEMFTVHKAAKLSPISNVKLATIHEFGSDDGRIPERSFIRSTLSAKESEYLRELQKIAADAYQVLETGGTKSTGTQDFATMGGTYDFATGKLSLPEGSGPIKSPRKIIRGGLFLLGNKYRTDIIMAIKAGIDPPLSPITVARKKGETTPLIDTGQMLNAITAVVRNREEIQ